MERYTIQKYHWDTNVRGQNDWSYWASMAGPTNGHARTEAEAVEALASNLESIAAAIRAGEIWFVRTGELKEEPVDGQEEVQS